MSSDPDAPVKREDAGPTYSAAAEECVVCIETYPQAEGAECPGGHFTCNGCIGMLCAQALERDPVAVSDVEKRQKSYSICCANSTSACDQAFAVKSLARALSPERFEELGDVPRQAQERLESERMGPLCKLWIYGPRRGIKRGRTRRSPRQRKGPWSGSRRL